MYASQVKKRPALTACSRCHSSFSASSESIRPLSGALSDAFRTESSPKASTSKHFRLPAKSTSVSLNSGKFPQLRRLHRNDPSSSTTHLNLNPNLFPSLECPRPLLPHPQCRLSGKMYRYQSQGRTKRSKPQNHNISAAEERRRSQIICSQTMKYQSKKT